MSETLELDHHDLPVTHDAAGLGGLPPDFNNLSAVLPTHLDVVVAAPSTQSHLSAQALIEGGLIPVQAWMRTAKTKNAKRVAEARAKRESDGIKQLNLSAPLDRHDVLRAVVKAPDSHVRLIAEILAHPTDQAGRDQKQLWRLSTLAKSSAATLAKVDDVLGRSLIVPIDPVAHEKRQKQLKQERQRHEELGKKIATLSGLRRWIIWRLGGLE